GGQSWVFFKILDVNLKNGYGFGEFTSYTTLSASRDADNVRGSLWSTPGDYGGGGGGGQGGYGRWEGSDRYGPPIRTDYRLIVENLSSRCIKLCVGLVHRGCVHGESYRLHEV
uniref:Uncharacterized protein n=1 Tax=Amphilophus citrinellus TaxID=61819 RepID=A0A3Q0SM60_AMPCI